MSVRKIDSPVTQGLPNTPQGKASTSSNGPEYHLKPKEIASTRFRVVKSDSNSKPISKRKLLLEKGPGLSSLVKQIGMKNGAQEVKNIAGKIFLAPKVKAKAIKPSNPVGPSISFGNKID